MTLPQLSGDFFLTDAGIETSLIFNDGLDLPSFAAFDLLKTSEGSEALRRYFRTYAELARTYRSGVVLETPTWRANADWGDKLGYTAGQLAEANVKSVRLLQEIRDEWATPGSPVVISGCIGPRGDGYVPGTMMSEDEAQTYHAVQIRTFAEASVDLVTAITMNYVQEAVGITRAANEAGLPAVISFTLETDGRLPTGQALGDAIGHVDDVTGGYPAYFMINCAHPSHFAKIIAGDEQWTQRIRGLRANASTMSHAELDEATELDAGDPEALARDYADLKRTALKHLNVLGGCCGTDDRHIDQIARSCSPLFRRVS